MIKPSSRTTKNKVFKTNGRLPPGYHQTSITLAPFMVQYQHGSMTPGSISHISLPPCFFNRVFISKTASLQAFRLVSKKIVVLFRVQHLASGKLTKLSFRDWSSARRSHFSTCSTCLPGRVGPPGGPRVLVDARVNVHFPKRKDMRKYLP